jgi:hypothetical protein
MNTEAHRTSLHPLLHKLVSAHRITAGVLFITLILFVAVNLALWAAYTWHDHVRETHPVLVHPKEWLAAAFPGWSHADLKAMLDEHWGGGGFSYDDYVMFKRAPVRGRYVNVSENGVRVSRGQGPWPPAPTNFNVFVFGGSTMFGTWLPDEQTVPSFLQAALARRLATNVCVYNFGVPYYYSTQERLRFERLLGQGIVPHVAVFVDGLNDFDRLDDTPAGRERFVKVLEAANQTKTLLAALVQELPAARLVRSITVPVRAPVRHDPATLPAKTARVVATYRENKLMIESLCAAHNVAPVFVWQPIPRYNYDLKYFPWYHTLRTYTQEPQAVGYPQMRALYDRGALGKNFLWCADLQAGEHECLYVDICHYTAKFSEKFGEAIAALSLERELLPNVAQGPEERRLNQFK